MSLESFKEMLRNLKSEYSFNFAMEDDSAYFFEEFGGEERLKTKFPAIYESYLKAREGALKRMHSNTEEGSNCIGELDKIRIEPIETGSTLCRLSATMSCAFIDETREVSSQEPAAPWTGITLQTTITDKFSLEPLVNISRCLVAENSYNGNVLSGIDEYSYFKNRSLDTRVAVKGKDASGKLNYKVFPGEQDVEAVELYTIADIKINDPAPKNNKHRISNEIMMLYGRMNEQGIYADADYKGDDYYKNTFDAASGKVHLLLPISGEVVFNYGVEPLNLYSPQTGEKLTRSKATYDYKKQEFVYRSDIKDDTVLYAKLKECFQKDPYKPAQLTSLKFDIKIADTNRSNIDWHTDVEGEQDGNPKTLFLRGSFTYQVKNQLGDECLEQITIRSISSKDLVKTGRKYYEYEAGTNLIYIPPITIYWGCFGKDVKIKLSDLSEKFAKDIESGDKLLGCGGKELTVEDVVTGRDTTIYQIVTQDGRKIQVSGGHPMMKAGECVRASRIEAGDRLNLAGGELAVVKSVEVVDYNDTVYNFTFVGEDAGNYIVANDFYSGDLRMQNTKEAAPERLLTSEEKQFIAEMMMHNEELNEQSLYGLM